MLRNNKNDQTALRWLVAMKAPDQSRETHEAFFKWLAEKPEHQIAFLRAEQAWVAGGALVPEQSGRRWGFNHLFFSTVSVMACLCIVWFWGYFSGEAPVTEKKFVHTNIGIQEILLSDGSVVVVKGPTKFTFSLSENNRELKLAYGEAFLKITNNPHKPFYVLTEVGIVRVIGTEFSVETLQHDLLVKVLSGVVGISPRILSQDMAIPVEPLVTLRHNQQIKLQEALNGDVPKTIDATNEIAWRTGQMAFDGESLEEALKSLNPYMQKPIIVKTPALRAREIFGVVSLVDNEAAANALAVMLGVQLVENETDFVLESSM